MEGDLLDQADDLADALGRRLDTAHGFRRLAGDAAAAFGRLPRRQRELVDQDRELQRKRREFQEDLSQRKNEELGAVVERTNRVIKQIFETEKYDLILQEAVFWSPKVDITDKVIKALNAQGGK